MHWLRVAPVQPGAMLRTVLLCTIGDTELVKFTNPVAGRNVQKLSGATRTLFRATTTI